MEKLKGAGESASSECGGRAGSDDFKLKEDK